MEPFSSILEVLASIQSSFDRAAAKGERAVIQFDVTGGGGGRYWVRIEDEACSYGTGDAPVPPSATITCTTEDCLGLMNGTLRPMIAFAQGRLKVKGNMIVAAKMQRWFPTRR